MLYVVAIFLPPVAVLLAGKPFQAIFNIFLCILFWIPGMLHAIFVVHNHYADDRTKRIIRATQEAADQQAAATRAATAAQIAGAQATAAQTPQEPPAQPER
jgi:uncharacterized membrane protein YqaE (UPF0057 family)